MGEVDDKFPVFQKERNSVSDFSTTAIKGVFVFFAYWTKAEQKEKGCRKKDYG